VTGNCGRGRRRKETEGDPEAGGVLPLQLCGGEDPKQVMKNRTGSLVGLTGEGLEKNHCWGSKSLTVSSAAEEQGMGGERAGQRPRDTLGEISSGGK